MPREDVVAQSLPDAPDGVARSESEALSDGVSPGRAFRPSPAAEEMALRGSVQPSGRQPIAASMSREGVAPEALPDAPGVVARSETAMPKQGANAQEEPGGERVMPLDIPEAAPNRTGLVGQTGEAPADEPETQQAGSRLNAASPVSREDVAVQTPTNVRVVPPSAGGTPEPVADAQGQADSRRPAISARPSGENPVNREAGMPQRPILAGATAPFQAAAGTQVSEDSPAVDVTRPDVPRPETPPVATQPAQAPERRNAPEFRAGEHSAPEAVASAEASGVAQSATRRREAPQFAASQNNTRATVLTSRMPESVRTTTVHSAPTPSSDPPLPVADDVGLNAEAEGADIELGVNRVHENAIPTSGGGQTAQPLQSDALRPELAPRFQPAAAPETAAAGRADSLSSPETLEDAYRINDQLVRGMRMFSRNGTSQVTMRLDPPELGEVTIRLVSENRVLSGEIAVGSREVHEVVQRNMAGLREALANQGIQVDRIEVSVDGRGTSGADREPSNPAWQDRSGNGTPDGRQDPQRRPFQREAWPQQRQPIFGDGRVDLTA